MRIEDLEEAEALRKERSRILKVLDEYSAVSSVTIVFNKQKPLDVFSQVEIENQIYR